MGPRAWQRGSCVLGRRIARVTTSYCKAGFVSCQLHIILRPARAVTSPPPLRPPPFPFLLQLVVAASERLVLFHCNSSLLLLLAIARYYLPADPRPVARRRMCWPRVIHGHVAGNARPGAFLRVACHCHEELARKISHTRRRCRVAEGALSVLGTCPDATY